MSNQEQASASTEKMLFYHSKANMFFSKTKFPRITVCGIIEESKNGRAAIKFGFSRCSIHDQFSKTRGRQLAEFRAKNNPSFLAGFAKKFTLSKFTELAQLLAYTIAVGTPMGIGLVENVEKISEPVKKPVIKEKRKFTEEEIAQFREAAKVNNKAVNLFEN